MLQSFMGNQYLRPFGLLDIGDDSEMEMAQQAGLPEAELRKMRGKNAQDKFIKMLMIGAAATGGASAAGGGGAGGGQSAFGGTMNSPLSNAAIDAGGTMGASGYVAPAAKSGWVSQANDYMGLAQQAQALQNSGRGQQPYPQQYGQFQPQTTGGQQQALRFSEMDDEEKRQRELYLQDLIRSNYMG